MILLKGLFWLAQEWLGGGRGGDMNVCGCSHPKSHEADPPNRPDMPFIMSVLSQKPGFLQPQKTEAGSHLPKEGYGIMLPPLPFLSFLSLISYLLNPAFTPDPISTPSSRLSRFR